jgi:hypothetical protein
MKNSLLADENPFPVLADTDSDSVMTASNKYEPKVLVRGVPGFRTILVFIEKLRAGLYAIGSSKSIGFMTVLI